MVVLHFPADRLLDIDTPEDYARAEARVAGEAQPSGLGG